MKHERAVKMEWSIVLVISIQKQIVFASILDEAIRITLHF